MSFLHLLIHFMGHLVWARPMLVAGETKKNKTCSGKQRVFFFWRILIQCKSDRKEASKRDLHRLAGFDLRSNSRRRGIEKIH